MYIYLTRFEAVCPEVSLKYLLPIDLFFLLGIASKCSRKPNLLSNIIPRCFFVDVFRAGLLLKVNDVGTVLHGLRVNITLWACLYNIYIYIYIFVYNIYICI